MARSCRGERGSILSRKKNRRTPKAWGERLPSGSAGVLVRVVGFPRFPWGGEEARGNRKTLSHFRPLLNTVNACADPRSPSEDRLSNMKRHPIPGYMILIRGTSRASGIHPSHHVPKPVLPSPLRRRGPRALSRGPAPPDAHDPSGRPIAARRAGGGSKPSIGIACRIDLNGNSRCQELGDHRIKIPNPKINSP
jgi:hypothetical protein